MLRNSAEGTTTLWCGMRKDANVGWSSLMYRSGLRDERGASKREWPINGTSSNLGDEVRDGLPEHLVSQQLP